LAAVSGGSWENTGWLSTICERWIWSQPRGAFCERATFYNTVNRGTEAIAEFEHALMLDRNLVYTHALIGMAKTALGRAEPSSPITPIAETFSHGGSRCLH
jgi:hypothetical protein